MRRIWSLLLPAGALLLLASFYLPWQEPSLGDSGGVVAVLSGSFAASNGIDGWSSGVGPAAGLVTFLLAAAAAFAVARPRLSARLPLGRCALLAGYFAIAVGIEARSSARLRAVAAPGVHFHYAYGAYVGAAGTIVMLLGAGALRRAAKLEHDLAEDHQDNSLSLQFSCGHTCSLKHISKRFSNQQ